MGQAMEHVGNEEEASESASNDAVVKTIGRRTRPLRGERERLSRTEKENVLARNGSAKTTVKCGGLRFGDVALGPVSREGWKPTVKPRSRTREDIRTEGGGGK